MLPRRERRPIVAFNTARINNARPRRPPASILGINYVNDLGRLGTLRNSLQATYQTNSEDQRGQCGRRVSNSRVAGASFAIAVACNSAHSGVVTG